MWDSTKIQSRNQENAKYLDRIPDLGAPQEMRFGKIWAWNIFAWLWGIWEAW